MKKINTKNRNKILSTKISENGRKKKVRKE